MFPCTSDADVATFPVPPSPLVGHVVRQSVERQSVVIVVVASVEVPLTVIPIVLPFTFVGEMKLSVMFANDHGIAAAALTITGAMMRVAKKAMSAFFILF